VKLYRHAPYVFIAWCLIKHQGLYFLVRFQVLAVVTMNITVFWVLAPCSLLETYRRLRGSYCLHHYGDLPDDGAVSISETSASFYETTQRNIQKTGTLNFALYSPNSMEESFLRILYSLLIKKFPNFYGPEGSLLCL
jgi:hypothetical protein